MNEYNNFQTNNGSRRIIFLIGVLLLVIGVSLVIFYETKVNHASSSISVPTVFVIAKGESARQIAFNLEEKKIIRDPNIFIIYTYIHNAKSKIQAGEYLLDPTMSITEVVDIITNGAVVKSERNVTVIEGLTNKQLANSLVNREVIESASELDEVLKKNNFGFKYEAIAKQFNYEGFLFPDTYTLNKSATLSDLVSKMLNNFQSKITDEMLADMENDGHTLSNVLILASIIEKEVGRNKQTITDADLKTMQEERKLVASVFYNRLEVGMALESDATVNYVTGKADRSVTIEDTKIKSPYNTYANRGLPPGPISNPGMDSIMAAIYPAESDYLFFLNSPDGVAYFGKNLDEHNQNRAKYLR